MTMILVMSPKGGVGVTTVAAELARRLAIRGRDVVAVNLTDQDALGYRLSSPAPSDDGFDEASTTLAGIVYRQADASCSTGRLRVDFAMSQLRPETVVIVDVAAGDREARDILIRSADLTLCVLAADAGSLAVLPQAKSLQDGNPHYVLNLIDERRTFAIDVVTLFGATFGDRLIGSIRNDEAANEALAMLGEIAPGSAAAHDFEALAGRVDAMLAASEIEPIMHGAA